MEQTILKRIFFVILPVVIVAGLLIYFIDSFQTNAIPADFTAARQKAAAVSQDIVSLTSETAIKIEAVNSIQSGGNTERLMILINEAKSSNATAYQKAFDLSNALQQMAESLNTIRSSRQQFGYEAVALELSLVSEFISYTGSLNDFLSALTRSVMNSSFSNQKAVNDALSKVNQKADLINGLNRTFLQKMAAFDQVD